MSRQISMMPILAPRRGVDPVLDECWDRALELGLPRPLIGRLLKLSGGDAEALLGTVTEAQTHVRCGRITGSVIAWVCAEYMVKAPAAAHDEIRKAAKQWERAHGVRNGNR